MIRCSPAFKKVLQLLIEQKDGYYFDMTQADILHELLHDAARHTLPATRWYKETINEI